MLPNSLSVLAKTSNIFSINFLCYGLISSIFNDGSTITKNNNLFAISYETKHKFILTPGRYVGLADEEDDGIPFEEKMFGLLKELSGQIDEEKKLDNEIKKQLKNIGFNL